jgi:hypothetical protein
LERKLARDVRFRLREVVRLREAQNLDVDALSAVLAKYPDPDASAKSVVPIESFKEIDAALSQTIGSLPDVSEPKDWETFFCDLECHIDVLVRELRYGTTDIDNRLASLDVTKLSEGVALNVVGLLIKNRFYADYNIDYPTQQCLEGFGALDLPQEILGYKPRPLEGVWATPPFLHNGSVPSLYQMISPPHERDQRFFVGRREFDPVQVGYVTKPADEEDDAGFWLDASVPGNRSIGHGFDADKQTWEQHRRDPNTHHLARGVIGPKLSEEERWALVEYLKVHRDLPATPQAYEPPQCNLWGQTL